MRAQERREVPVRFAVADDLTGAVEAAAALGRSVDDASVLLARAICRSAQNAHAVRVLDLDVREAPAAEARAAMDGAAVDAPLFVKIDSLLRGGPGALVAARVPVVPTVVCPALPAAGRTTVDARLRVASGPVRFDRTSVRERLGPAETRSLGLDVVRGPQPRLRESMREAAEYGQAAVCDAQTDADLDRVAAAALALPGPTLVGSGGLAAALGRLAGRHDDAAPGPTPLPHGMPVLAVIGSAEESARAQVDRLVQVGGERVVVETHTEPEALAHEVIAALGRSPVALTVTAARADSDPPAAVVSRIARTVAAVIDALPHARLFLTGGHTARTVLNALDVRRLDLVARLDVATVHCRTDDGRDVITRPGSLGTAAALVEAVVHLGGALPATVLTTSSAAADPSTEGSS